MYSKFAELLKENSVTAYRVAKETGIPTSTLSDWKTGRSTPKIDKLQKIANYFDVSITHFTDE
ncbi:helix-turn-helix domain-containing protein [Clostridium beijerinckii]|uniref:Transcriptional regulator with XRE-family HTH domain n=1 Tax=Clostridium beijerinckii TaxID=1520 RepID=A0AAE5H842_CLOBE|nr:helix-turn-helix transcriptional regulator [Clostridium beijerinckii]NSB15871.1 transcriptional regulator with XRE-family HTH domain [Clostridium beijerinckii]OOM27994.1 helix-turn-helix protein [Clostridium beijerinckii]